MPNLHTLCKSRKGRRLHFYALAMIIAIFTNC